MEILEIKNLHVKVEGKEILKGVNLVIKSGEMHIIMGPNGSGKSTLCYALMGHPNYEVTEGVALFNGENILELPADKRAHLGLFLGFQYPREVTGVTFGNFLRIASNAVKKAQNSTEKPIGPLQFYPIAQKEIEAVKMDKSFIGRSLNEGFSGGEKKRAEIVQMAVLKPKMAMLDEIDSGLDIDALKTVAEGIQMNFEKLQPGMLIITHYQRILDYLKPHYVHVMSEGRIVKSGGPELAKQLESGGYAPLINN
jgi:Fe-S cluster assembly ATP-binding protein